MLWTWKFLLFEIMLFETIATINQVPLKKKLTVAWSEREPFLNINQNGTPTGLDVHIVLNFAKKFHFEVEYIFVNVSLNSVFSDEKYFHSCELKEILRFVNSNKFLE